MLSLGFRVRSTISCTASAASLPMLERRVSASRPLAACSPKKAPAIETTISTSGASEKIE